MLICHSKTAKTGHFGRFSTFHDVKHYLLLHVWQFTSYGQVQCTYLVSTEANLWPTTPFLYSLRLICTNQFRLANLDSLDVPGHTISTPFHSTLWCNPFKCMFNTLLKTVGKSLTMFRFITM